MFDLLPVEGGLLSQKRKQIVLLNDILKKMNHTQKSDPERLPYYYGKLEALHRKIMGKGEADHVIKQWFLTHPLYKTQQQIIELVKHRQLEKKVKKLVKQLDLDNLYSKYTNKDSFKRLVQDRLMALDTSYKVTSLGGGNNPILRITLNKDQQFIMRFVRVDSQDEDRGVSPKQAREQASGMPEVPQPFLMHFVASDFQEKTYIEFGHYYPQGSIDELFKQLNAHKKDSPDKETMVLLYARKFLEFYLDLNRRGVWYTDLKPSNILLDSQGGIVISDIKGLLPSHESKVVSSKTNTSKAYYQSSVFEGKAINLERLQRQTLANTLYQLTTGQLPVSIKGHYIDWKYKYNFNQDCFKSPEGELIKSLILQLNMSRPKPLTHYLTLINDHLNQEQLQPQEEEAARLPTRDRDDSQASITL
ncbi:hypothetical protein [Legionella erythra]|uniref:Protein kinase domain protein n=1 Tax=Legionella erythra TaxID=448 RepID=A0A0W0TGH8_LEGER|nr:hypothetical protein [Legionella erythra]KTC94681.1 Protein kinase domain protein [Legionella erythra]